MEIKIMTFNIRYECKSDGINCFENRREKIKAVIKKENPDLIGFQEVTDEMKAWILQNIDDYNLFGCGRDSKYHGESMLMGYKKGIGELISLDNKWLSNTPDIAGSTYGEDQSVCPRMFTSIVLKIDEIKIPILFINTHLDHEGEMARQMAAKQIQKYIKSKKEEGQIVILTGDFNALPTSKEIKLFDKVNSPIHNLTDNIGGTYHGFGLEEKMIKIDYIFSNAEKISSYIVPDEHKDGIYYSDHFAVCAIIKIKNNA